MFGHPEQIGQTLNVAQLMKLVEIYQLKQAAKEINWLLSRTAALAVSFLASEARAYQGLPVKQVPLAGEPIDAVKNFGWHDYHNVKRMTAHVVEGICYANERRTHPILKGVRGIAAHPGYKILPSTSTGNHTLRVAFCKRERATDIRWRVSGSRRNNELA